MLLAREETNVNAADEEGLTALLYAALGGYSEIVAMLVANEEVDVNTVGNIGCTALMYALQRGHYEVANLLLRIERVDVNIRDFFDCVALRYAVSNSSTNIDVILLLVKKSLVTAIDNEIVQHASENNMKCLIYSGGMFESSENQLQQGTSLMRLCRMLRSIRDSSYVPGSILRFFGCYNNLIGVPSSIPERRLARTRLLVASVCGASIEEGNVFPLGLTLKKFRGLQLHTKNLPKRYLTLKL